MSEIPGSEISSVSAFPRFLKQLVFLPFLQYPVLPRTPDLSNPQTFGLSNTDYQKIPLKSSKSKETLGSWYMKPMEQSTSDSPRVILYLHGNAHNRAQPHRVALCKLLQEAGYHVFSIDYRGYGDSSPVELSETTVVEDARTALAWIHDTFQNKAKIFILGHSLGAAISTHMVSSLHDAQNSSDICGPRIAGLILQSPFNKMLDEVMTFLAAKALSSVGVNVEDKLKKGDVEFDSESWLPGVLCPVVIFHAKVDTVIPFRLGNQLFDQAWKAGKRDITFVPIVLSADKGCGHKNLYKSQDFLKQLKQFIDTHN